MKTQCTRQQLLKEYLIPLLGEFLILAVFISIHEMFKNIGPLIQECRMVGDEMSSPTLGRLIYVFLSFAMFVVFAHFASKTAEKWQNLVPCALGFAAGIALWQCVGEDVWHFYVGGINFAPLENITSFPLAVMYVMLLVYGYKNMSFDWGIWCTLASFAYNWFGHYIMIGIYPFFEKYVEPRTWNVTVGIIVGTFIIINGIFYLTHMAKNTRGRLRASMITYIGIAEIAFGIMEG